ncbi:hypothetical protein Pcinc_022203 [Petrolisthes cinctipes]|uniref:THAP-type domain-containing protein n=1 Tax=Petrolisthes cinctipes TaxID=88211 RepID=A0AAE1FI86_PETCI|nr:hypothetical protein Pcinc_022203 [Petrolisthes cinctipes]
MPQCSGWKCHNRSDHSKRDGKSFHRFPKDPKMRRKWIHSLRLENFTPTAHTVVCGDHFEDICLNRTGQTTRLREGSIPSIFDFPAHLLKKIKPRKPPPQRSCPASTSIIDALQPDADKEYDITVDHNYVSSPCSVTVRDKIKPCKPPPQRSCPASTSVIDALQPDADKEYEVTITTKEPTCNLAFNKARFLGAIKSTMALYKQYVGQDKPLQYLLTYKLSQDHLELFFCAIRASGGFRNNPTALQFMSAYKRLLLRHEIKSGTGNVSAQDVTKVLTSATTSSILKRAVEDKTEDIMVARQYDLIHRSPAQKDHDYADCPNFSNLSNYKEAAVGYIAGYVVKMGVSLERKMPQCSGWKCHNRTDNYKRDGKSFHKFPKDPKLRRKWIHSLRLENFTPTAHTVVCGDHFEDICLNRTGQTTRLREGSIPSIFDFPAHLLKKIKPRKPPPQRSCPASTSIIDALQPDADKEYDITVDHNYVSSPCSVTVRDKIKPRKPPPQRSCPASTSVIDALQPDADKEYEVTITTKEPTCNLAFNKASNIVILDHNYVSSPCQLKRKLDLLIDEMKATKRKLRTVQRRAQRQKKKNVSLMDIVKNLQETKLISDSCSNVL